MIHELLLAMQLTTAIPTITTNGNQQIAAKGKWVHKVTQIDNSRWTFENTCTTHDSWKFIADHRVSGSIYKGCDDDYYTIVIKTGAGVDAEYDNLEAAKTYVEAKSYADTLISGNCVVYQ